MPKNTKIKGAFTLIEIIVVIIIIGILSTVFLSSYRGVVEHSKVDVTAQEIKSVLESLKSKAENGVFEGQVDKAINVNVSKCYGVNFDKKQNIVQTFTSVYDTEKKVCDLSANKWENLKKLEFYNDVIISSFAPQKDLVDLSIYFIPSKAQMQIVDTNGNNLNEELTITLNHQTYPNYTRNLTIDPASGKVEINSVKE